MLHHRERCNAGSHTLHLGGSYDSGLLVPFIQRNSPLFAPTQLLRARARATQSVRMTCGAAKPRRPGSGNQR